MRVATVIFSMGLGLAVSSVAFAKISIAPYASVKSTKTKRKNKEDPTKEDEVVKQRNEGGVRAVLGLGRLFKVQASVGQSKLTTTQKTDEVKDEYGEIDFKADTNMDTSNPLNEAKITETQNNAKATLIFDPSFWIFFVRAKAGVTAVQRLVDTEITSFDAAGAPTTTKTQLTVGPRYGAHSGVGLGVKFSSSFYAVAEYGFEHYRFPEVEPFERELTVSFAVSL